MMLNGANRDNRQIITNIIGDSVLGVAYYSAHIMANIVSYGMIKDNSNNTRQDRDDVIFKVQMIPNGNIYLFKRKLDIYFHNINSSNGMIKTNNFFD